MLTRFRNKTWKFKYFMSWILARLTPKIFFHEVLILKKFFHSTYQNIISSYQNIISTYHNIKNTRFQYPFWLKLSVEKKSIFWDKLKSCGIIVFPLFDT